MAKATKEKVKATAKTQAEAEVKQELPKNPQEYSYRGDEQITISANLFLMLYRANDAAIRKGTTGHFPIAFQWVNAATGMPVSNPKEIDIKEGRVTQIMSTERTFSQGNYAETFEPWLFPDVVRAKDEMLKVHSKNVEEGIATKISVLQEEAKAQAEAKAKEEQEAIERVKRRTAEAQGGVKPGQKATPATK